MAIGFSLGHRAEVRQALTLRFSQEVLQKVENRLLQIALAFTQSLNEERFEARGSCPKCERKLLLVEIKTGWLDDPFDYTTRCPACENRFVAKLVQGVMGLSSSEVSFLCPAQTLHELKGKQGMSPVEIKATYKQVYLSAISNFGLLKVAFLKLGVVYEFEEVPEWKEKVKEFLGQIPDTWIAERVGVSPAIIRRMRKSAGIPPVRRSNLALEFV